MTGLSSITITILCSPGCISEGGCRVILPSGDTLAVIADGGPYFIHESGVLQTTLTIKTKTIKIEKAREYRVMLFWEKDGLKHGMSRKVEF